MGVGASARAQQVRPAPAALAQGQLRAAGQTQADGADAGIGRRPAGRNRLWHQGPRAGTGRDRQGSKGRSQSGPDAHR